jgi:hypothetical protein
MKSCGVRWFESLDETYHHASINEANRVVLETHEEPGNEGPHSRRALDLTHV